MERIDSLPLSDPFLNSETGRPFETCLMCGLSVSDKQHVIEKVIRNYPTMGTTEVIFEYAMCLECAGKMHFELSEESRARVTQYLSNHIVKREFYSEKDLTSAISNCAITGNPLSESSEYTVYAFCNGNQMVLGEFPYALSEAAQDEIMKLLSAKTLEVMDDFIGNHFSGPPEVMDILKRRPLLI